MQHPDEGMIHAWLDGELSEDQANQMAAHTSECPECAARVAEARGLVAASTRILTALDDVPAGVTPKGSAVPPTPLPRRHWYDRTDLRAAAAVLLVAGASLVLVRSGSDSGGGATREMLSMADKAPASSAVADSAAIESSAASQKMVGGVTEKPSMQAAISPPRSRVGADATAGFRSDRRKAAVDEMSTANARSAVLGKSKSEESVADVQSLKTQTIVGGPEERAAVSFGAHIASGPFGGVEGRVTDGRTGKGLPSVQVRVQGVAVGSTTDDDGLFRISNVPAGAQRLQIRHIGYETQSIPLAVRDGASVTAQVALAPSSVSLNEVVVTSKRGSSNFATTPLRVLRVDSTTATRRTVYEVSPGIEVTLAESPVDADRLRGVYLRMEGGRAATAPPRLESPPRDSAVVQVYRGGKTASDSTVGGLAGKAARENSPVASDKAAPAATATAAMAATPLNTLSWTDGGRLYTLSGRVATTELEVLKARLMQMRR